MTRINMLLYLILLLQFTAAVTGQRYLYLTVRVGDDVTLPCESLIADQNNCENTTWLYGHPGSRTVALVRGGQLVEAARAKSDRLSFSEKCSLVIKKVTEDDAGYYVCRQIRSGQQQGEDAVVLLSVVTMTEQKDTDVTFRCSMKSSYGCRHTVKWLFQGQAVDKNNPQLKTSQSNCSASVTFPTSHSGYTSRYNSFNCEVTGGNTREVKLFSFSPPQSSGEDTTTTTTTITTTTTTATTTAATTTTAAATSEMPPTTGNNQPQISPAHWRWIVVSVGLAALITSVVAVNIWIRTKEKETQTDELAVRYDVDDDTVNYENIRPAEGV
ncbi:uncharacterized protein LOC131990743 [Centropristis striata]|uniref:uncharacterized protein LOC131990743 n=1 Tax=Centropristis striata TaxID=184440 RepID=UPI0027E16975|nr:uncharacterized protein LOC131990743 [Centropristis striata]